MSQSDSAGRFSAAFRSRFCREAGFSLVSAGIYALSQWLLLKVLFRVMGAGTAGWYAYAMAIITPVLSFASFGLRSVLVTDSAREFAFQEYFTFRVNSTALGVVAAVFAYWALTKGEGTTPGELLAFVALVFYRGIEWVSDLAQGEYQRQGRMRIVLGAYALKLGLLIGGFITAALLTRRLDLSLAWLGFASAAVLVCYELPISRLRQSARMVGSAAALKKIGFISLPLATVLMISALQASIPRFFLKKTGSLEAVGIFAALSYFCVFGGFISAAMTNALSPILSEHRAQCRWASFRRALLLVVGADFLLALGLLLLFWCAGGWLLGIMFSAEVVPYARYLPLVALLALTSFWDAHLGCALTALRRFKSNLVVQIARLLVATPLALFLIQRWQLPGALWASIAFPCSSFIALIALIWRDVRGIEALPVRVHENSIGPIGLGALSGTSPSK